MSAPVVLVSVVCACGFSGMLPTRASCPSCRGTDARRLNRARLAALGRISSTGPDGLGLVKIQPATLAWLTRNRLIQRIAVDPVGERVRTRSSGAPAIKGARFRLTSAGVIALGIADALSSSARSFRSPGSPLSKENAR